MKSVTVYGQPGCMPCHMLRMALMKRDIEYEYRDVRKNLEHQKDMLEAAQGNFLTPTVVIGDRVMLNPQIEMIVEALE